MSSFYDDASLVVIPSGYKTSKVYAEKPTDGSGDLAFTRTGDTATRVNSAGLIERVRTNLLTYSQDVTNAAWTKSATTASANTTTAPDGTTTADTITETATSAQHAFFNSFTTGASIATFSVYLKANGRNFATIYPQGTSMAGYATVDLSNGTINTTGGSTFLRAAIESAGNGWYRIQVALTTTANSLACVVYLSNTLGGISPTYLGDGTSGVFVWGAQLETGDIATPYIPTTTAAVSVGPVANVPRLDYLGSTCPRLILEPQRQNLVTFSEQLNNAAWVKSAGGTGTAPSVTANNATSPDGYQNADTVIYNAGAGTTTSDQSVLYQAITTGAGSHTASFYAKTASGTAQLLIRLNSATYEKITITNQWQRFTLTQTLTAGTNYFEIIIRRGINEPLNATATVQLWGAQVEAGAYATSYIPTLAASATRGADACSKTGISSLIGQTEGTIYIEMAPIANNTSYAERLIKIYGGGQEIYLYRYSDNRLVCYGRVTGGLNEWSFDIDSVFNAANQTVKIAVGYKANDVAIYINGVQKGTDNTASMFSSLSTFAFAEDTAGSLLCPQRVKQTLLFKTRLTNAALAELTTL